MFYTAIEILSLVVHWHEEIKGINFQQNTSKLMIFANDIVFTIGYPKSSEKYLSKLILHSGAISGNKINNTKSVLMGVGLTEVHKSKINEISSHCGR